MQCTKPVVRIIGSSEAKKFIEAHHYSHRCPTGKNIFFGWFDAEGLYAVADYGIGVNTLIEAYLSRITGKDVRGFSSKKGLVGNLYELKRLCRTGERGAAKYPLTQFIAACHRILKRDHGIRFIVSFSDPEFDHNGGIYKASNFEHLGKTNPEMHVIDRDGIKRHRRYAYRWMKRHAAEVVGTTEQERLAFARSVLGLKPYKSKSKDRWFLDLGAEHARTKTRRETDAGELPSVVEGVGHH